MAKIVLGVGTSHTPLVSLESEWWPIHAKADPRLVPDYEERIKNPPSWLAAEVTPERFEEKYQACQTAIGELRKAIDDAKPDVFITVGDDQLEMFLEDSMPMIGVFTGESLVDHPVDKESLPPSLQQVYWAMHSEEDEVYPSNPSLAEHLVKQLVADEFDLTCVNSQLEGRKLGHAYTFVRRRLLEGRDAIPQIPVFLNTYYPPNTPSPTRCVKLGRSIAHAIASYPEDIRVAVAASGGLSHFVVDQELDREMIRCLEQADLKGLSELPQEKMVLGTSEGLNWITAGAVLAESGMKMELVDYVPAYRTLAESGVGCAFGLWR